MENLRNRIHVRLISSKKDYLKWTLKVSYVSPKIFDNDLVVIRKYKVTLKLNKPAYVGVIWVKYWCMNSIMITSKIIVTNQDYYSVILIVWCMKLKLKMFMKILVRIKNSLIFGIIQLVIIIQNIIMIQNKLLVRWKTKQVVLLLIVELEPKMHFFLVDDSSEHKNAKSVNKNVVAKINHSECKDVLLNNKCLRHSMNGFQIKHHKILFNINLRNQQNFFILLWF